MKGRLIFILWLLCFATLYSYAQNLVPNPSFEEYTSCPFSISQLSNAMDWRNPTGYSPDYFNICDTSGSAGVPNNTFGSQYAKTGNGYVGIISMIETDSREYIQTELLDTLVGGKNYLVKFFVNLGDICNYAAGNLGAYFSPIPVTNPNLDFFPFIPQISNSSNLNPLITTTDWVEVSGSFTAAGGERYLTIGNFNSDENTDTTHLTPIGSQWNASYHYIDDVSVECSDCFVNIKEFKNEINVTLSPNPASDFLDISIIRSGPKFVRIYDVAGLQIFQDDISPSDNFHRVDIRSYHSGLYIVKVQLQEALIIKQILINH